MRNLSELRFALQVPTSGPPKEAWRNCSGVVLEGDRRTLRSGSCKAATNRYTVSGRYVGPDKFILSKRQRSSQSKTRLAPMRLNVRHRPIHVQMLLPPTP